MNRIQTISLQARMGLAADKPMDRATLRKCWEDQRATVIAREAAARRALPSPAGRKAA